MSRDYWKKRFEILEESAIEKGADYYDSLDRQYREAEKRIESQISTWYQRFANNNNISLTEARRLLTSSELEELHWSVEEYIKHGKENAISQDWMRELENASAKVHISRLESLKLQLQQEVEVLYGNQVDGVDKLARMIYTDGYYHTAFEIQKGFNIGWDFQSLDTRRLDKVISKPWTTDGRTFSDKLWTQKSDLVSTLHTELTQAIIRGDAPDRAIKTIAKKFDVAKSKAGRLVMTESAYFSSVAQKDCFTELDVEQFEIVATLDSHTSPLCQSLDGKVQPMKVFEAGVTAPPFHPWCRTTTVPYFEDDEGFRAARDADGKTYYVPSDMTYEEWKNKFVKSQEIDGIRTPIDVEFDVDVSGYKKVEGGFDVRSGGQQYGSEVKIVTLNKRNTTEWDELPADAQRQLQWTSSGKPFQLPKGEYKVQRYVEGSSDTVERDEIAKSIGAEYIGFAFHQKNGQPFFIDFYQKDDELFYSIGKASVKKTVAKSSLKAVEKVASEREKLIIEKLGESRVGHISERNGDDWVSSMKEFHRLVGADGKPTILPDVDYDAIKSPTLYRGIAPQSRLRRDITTTSTTREMADEFFKSDSPFPSRGVYGDGVAYASPAYREIALSYATNGGTQKHGGFVIEFKLKNDARIITYEDALAIFRGISKKGKSKLLFNPRQHNAFDKEVGKAMNALGYDAILKHNGDNTGQDFYVILNRKALVTKERYITKEL